MYLRTYHCRVSSCHDLGLKYSRQAHLFFTMPSSSLPFVSTTHVVDLSRMTRDELIEVARKQANQIRDKNIRINNMENFIDSLTSVPPSVQNDVTPNSGSSNGVEDTPSKTNITDLFQTNSIDALTISPTTSLMPIKTKELPGNTQSSQDTVAALQDALKERDQIVAVKENELRQLSNKVDNWKSRVLDIIKRDENRLAELTSQLQHMQKEYDSLLEQTKQQPAHQCIGDSHQDKGQQMPEAQPESTDESDENAQESCKKEVTLLRTQIDEPADALQATRTERDGAEASADEDRKHLCTEYEEKIEAVQKEMREWKERARAVISSTESQCDDLRNQVNGLTEENTYLSTQVEKLKEIQDIHQQRPDTLGIDLINKIKLNDDGTINPEIFGQVMQEATSMYLSHIKTLHYDLHMTRSAYIDLVSQQLSDTPSPSTLHSPHEQD